MLIQYMVAVPYEEQDAEETRLDTLLTRFLKLVKLNENYYTLMEELFGFIFKIVGRYAQVKKWFYMNIEKWEWIIKWFEDNGNPPNPSNQGGHVKFVKVYGPSEER